MEIKVVRQILEWNEDCSNEIKETLKEKKVCLINVMGSPGAGKTSLILEMVKRLAPRYRAGVLEGDIAGEIDAKKMDEMGIPVVQLNTDGACHIEAMSVQHILPMFRLEDLDVLFVENIGNLVCPAEFDLGADLNMMILSVPEGHDKILKYPLMFSMCDVLVVNKADYLQLPSNNFDVEFLTERMKAINPEAKVFVISAYAGDGVPELVAWLKDQVHAKRG